MKKNNYLVYMSIFLLILFCSCSFLDYNRVSASVDNSNSDFTLDFHDFSNWRWTDLEIVSTESDDLSQEAFVAIDKADRVHVVWNDHSDLGGTDEDIFYKLWRDGAWSTTYVVSTESTGFSNMPTLDFDSQGNVHFVWTDTTDLGGAGTDYDIFYKFWNITSDVWAPTKVISDVSTLHAYRPIIAIDSLDVIHIAWYDSTDYLSSGSDEDVYYEKYEDGTWSTTQLISQESLGTSTGIAMDIDSQGNVYIAWHDSTAYNSSGTDNDIVYRYWNVATSSWTPINVISTESDYDSTYPSLRVDSVDNIHVTWRDISEYLWAGGEYDIFYKSFKQSTGWSNTEIVSAGSTDGAHNPSLAVNHNGQVFVTWVDYSTYGALGIDPDIFIKVRDPIVDGWTNFKVLSKESTFDSYTPTIDVDKNGNVYVVWFDGTDLLGSGTDYDIFYRAFGALPSSPEPAYISPNPTVSHSIDLKWDDIPGALSYHIYRSSKYIWTTDSLVPIASVLASPHTDTLSSEGIYYYVIVAENRFGNGTHSICQPVKYELPSLSEILIPVGIFLGFSTVVFVVVVIRRKNVN